MPPRTRSKVAGKPAAKRTPAKCTTQRAKPVDPRYFVGGTQTRFALA